ncbi:MAG: NifB/NifX family molybdenum-iron cluster-binding protein [Chromatiales bacterium]|jgi:nitrogen fixation protein NifX
MTTAIKVAFATSDMKHVDQHFGAAQAFAIYAVDRDQARFVEASEFGHLDMSRSEGRWRAPIEDGDPTPGGATGPDPSEFEAPVSHRRSHPRDAGPLLNASGHNEDKLVAKIAVLEDCVAVYSQAVGASAINQLKAKGIQPVKVEPDTPIEQLLGSLQEELREGPSSWLAKAIVGTLPADPGRFDRMEAEGWSE